MTLHLLLSVVVFVVVIHFLLPVDVVAFIRLLHPLLFAVFCVVFVVVRIFLRCG